MLEIPGLGVLRSDPNDPRSLVSDPTAVPYFDGQRLPFVLPRVGADADDVAAAVAAFLALGAHERALASEHVFRVYEDHVKALDPSELEEMTELGELARVPAAVWAHVRPNEIVVSRRGRAGDSRVYVQILASCDWDPEHGLQLVYRSGMSLSRVSPQDGHLTTVDAYGLREEEDRIAF